MIDENTYLKSLKKLEDKEKLKDLAIQNGYNFLEHYNKALQISKTENKHIFLLFYIPGCDGCNVIKYLIDNDKQIQNYLNKYIILDCDISKTLMRLNHTYNIYSYPTCLIINHQEKILKQKIGITVKDNPASDFINWLK
jgi:thioredoxin-related protein